MKIILEQKRCIGCGSCAAIDPKNFKFVKSKSNLIDGKEIGDKVFEKEVKENKETEEAADVCPAMCIILQK